MSHLTDGQLHAYLDGGVEALDGATLVEARSHLAACGDCGARLEAARLVREEAASLLGRAVPSSFAPPPFRELERRAAHLDAVRGAAGEPTSGRSAARGGGVVGGRLFRRPGSLAWAASLTVALTAGWLARGTVDSGMADRSAVEAPSESIALQGKQEASALDQSVDRDRAESRPGSIAGEEGGADGGSGGLALPATESPSELKESRSAQATPPPEFFSREGGEPDEEGPYLRRGDGVAMDEVAAETTGDEATPADDRPARVGEQIDAGRLEPGSRERVTAKMIRPDVAGRSAASIGTVQGPENWQPVRREQAEQLLGGALKTVEGLRVLSMYARATGAAPEVWTAQQLASGHQLNLRQMPVGGDRFGDLEEGVAANERNQPAADPVSEMEARPQPSQQAYYETLESLLVDGFLIEARAPLSADSLRVLLSRLKD